MNWMHQAVFPLYRSIPAASLLALLPTVLLAAQGSQDDSIPEPTELGNFVAQDDNGVVVSGSPYRIASDESAVEFVVIGVVAAGEERPRHGVRVSLGNSGEQDTLYLDAAQLAQLHSELEELQRRHSQGRPCEATARCIFGVARCRPSQTERQAFCPGILSSPDGSWAVAISTARGHFRFPSLEPAVLAAGVDAAIAELGQRTSAAQAGDGR